MADLIKGIISLDGSSLLKTIDQLEKELKGFQDQLKKTTNVAEFNKLNQQIATTQAQIKALNSGAMKGLAAGANQANTSMVNLSRVVQDAPFGFIGIANNIDPLLQSFQSLKASTGTTGGALKALGASLAGPAGLALAVSTVSSLLVVFGDRLFSTGSAAKAADDGVKALASNVATELVGLTSLVGLIQNVNTSNEDRVKALRAVNEQYGKYLPSLDKEEITANNISKAYELITESLLRQAVVKGLQNEIQKQVEETAAKIIQASKAQQQLIADNQKAAAARTEQAKKETGAYADLDKRIAANNAIRRDGVQAQIVQNRETQKAISTTNVYGNIVKKLTKDLQDQLKPLLGIVSSFDDLDVTIKDLKIKPDGIDIDFEGQFAQPVKLDKPIPIEGRIFDFDAAQEGTDLLKKLEYAFSDRLKSMEVAIKAPKLNFSQKLLDDNDKLKQALANTKKLAETVAGSLSQAFSSAFSAIANGANVFEALGNAIKGVIVDLIQAAIRGLIFKAVMNLILPGSGSAAGGLGSLLGGFGGFRAGGGPVGAGRSYIVGENGPELFTPGVSGNIIPNGRLGSVSNSFGGMQVQGVLTGRGNDLVAIISAAGRSNGRLI